MATIDVQIGANNKDSIQATTGAGGEPTNDDRFAFGQPGGAGNYEFVGAAWAVTIPAGATIDTAYVQWKCFGAAGVLMNSTIQFEKSSNSPASFTTGVNNISGRTKTSASVAWTATFTDDIFNTSPEIKTILQELVDAYDYSSGGFVVCVLTSASVSLCGLYGYTNSAGESAKLHIEYTAGGAAVAAKIYQSNYAVQRSTL